MVQRHLVCFEHPTQENTCSFSVVVLQFCFYVKVILCLCAIAIMPLCHYHCDFVSICQIILILCHCHEYCVNLSLTLCHCCRYWIIVMDIVLLS